MLAILVVVLLACSTSVTAINPCTSDCILAPAGSYPDCFDCQRYHECDGNSNDTPLSCPAGENFDRRSMSCLPTGTAECGLDFVYVGRRCIVDCSSGVTGQFPMCFNCNRFIVCDGTRLVMNGVCQAGMVFNINVGLCTPPKRAICAMFPIEPVISPQRAPQPTALTTAAPTNPPVIDNSCITSCDGVTVDGRRAVCGDCTKSFVCIGGNLAFERVCPGSLLFDSVSLTCTSASEAICGQPGSGTVTNPVGANSCITSCNGVTLDGRRAVCGDCTKSLVCIGGNLAFERVCPGSLLFDSVSLTCTSVSEAVCGQPGSGTGTNTVVGECTKGDCQEFVGRNGIFPICDRCRLSAVCLNGVNTQTRECPGDLLFDSEKKVCAQENNAVCATLLNAATQPTPTPPPALPPTLVFRTNRLQCINTCIFKRNGNHQSCRGCNEYASCYLWRLTYQNCPPTLSWDDTRKDCRPVSSTCWL